jgi:glycosyltransferase involved in cell wall biosynthesis
MKLTICLITKGRREFLSNTMSSLNSVLKEEDIELVIIDNGSVDSIRDTLSNWRDQNPSKITLLRFNENQVFPNTWWPLLQNLGVNWVVFPGDDDELNPEIIKSWRAALKVNPKLVAYASSMEVIDSKGKRTGETIYPRALDYSSIEELIALSIHGTPFAWPGLFFNLSVLPKNVPTSRFIFDWWVGFNLILIGDIEVTREIGTKYRVYPKQESRLAPQRRVNFEALIWVTEILNSDVFKMYLNSQSFESKKDLLRKIIEIEPIYGDSYLSNIILFEIYRILQSNLLIENEKTFLFETVASSFGVYLKKGESLHFFDSSIRGKVLLIGNSNITVIPAENSCRKLQDLRTLLGNEEASKKVTINCNHSMKVKSHVFIDCDKLIFGENYINSDLVIGEITRFFEERGYLTNSYNSNEKEVVRIFRKYSNSVPRPLKSLIRRISRKR